jgi:hypothetical protein
LVGCKHWHKAMSTGLFSRNTKGSTAKSRPPTTYVFSYAITKINIITYCNLTSASTLIFLMIWPPICLFFIKSCTWWYVTAYLHALIQLYYSFTSTCSVLHRYITGPLCKFRIYLAEPIRLPSPHRINFSVRLSVRPFVRLSGI